jgi:anti-sigma regulatory factor (Ser/Thr protein kinase)
MAYRGTMSLPNNGSVTGFQQDIVAVPASLPTIRLELDRLLAGQLVSPRLSGDIRLAVTEACANAVIHAYSDGEVGTVLVTASVSADALIVTIRDYGRGIPTPSSAAGSGMALMRALADTVSIGDADPGAAVRMTFRLY